MKAHSSREAAKKLGISLMTLQRYIAAGKITAPKLQTISGIKLRLWTARDIERAKKQIDKRTTEKKRATASLSTTQQP